MNGIKLFMGIAFTIFGSMFTFMMSPDAIAQIQNASSISELMKGVFLLFAVNIFTLIGLIFTISEISNYIRIKDISNNGVELLCKITKIKYKENRDTPEYFICEYQENGKVYQFKSEEINGHYKIIEGGSIIVYVNPEDYTDYYIDFNLESNLPYIHALCGYEKGEISKAIPIMSLIMGIFTIIPTVVVGFLVLYFLINFVIIKKEPNSIIFLLVLLFIFGFFLFFFYFLTIYPLKRDAKVRNILKNSICIPCKVTRKEEYFVHTEHGMESNLYFTFEALNKYDFLKMEDGTELKFVDWGRETRAFLYDSYNIGDVINLYVIPDNPFEYVIEY